MNGLYLHFLLHEIAGILIGRVISEVLINDRFIQVRMKKKALFISLYPDCLAMYFGTTQQKDYARNVFFTDALRDLKITGLQQAGFQPMLMVELARPDTDETKRTILILTFYHEAPNFVLRTENRQKALFARFIVKRPRPGILDAADNVSARDFDQNDLYKHYDGIDKSLSRELNPERIRELKTMVHERVYAPALVSVSPLNISLFARAAGQLFNSFNALFEQAIKEYCRQRVEAMQKAQLTDYRRRITDNIEKMKKRLEQSRDYENCLRAGNLILANIDRVPKGAKEIILDDPTDGKQTKINLDPAINAQTNAQQYFSKYKKLKRAIPKIKEKIDQLRSELNRLTLDNFRPMTGQIAERREKSEVFRKFELDSGSLVYVGKSSRTNDELTFRFAMPNDFFFHVRGYEGAHVILRHRAPKGQRPSHHDMRISAEIAAYFSKAKTQKKVPVSFTERKYLKKGKRVKPGAAIMLREEVMFVDPHLPES